MSAEDSRSWQFEGGAVASGIEFSSLLFGQVIVQEGKRLLVGSFLVRVAFMLLGLAGASVLARSLGPSNFGDYSFITSVALLCSVPAQFGMQQLVLRETAKANSSADQASVYAIWLWALRVVLLSSISVFLVYICAVLNFHRNDPRRDLYLLGSLLILTLPWAPVIGSAMRGLGGVISGLLPDLIIRPGVLVCLLLSSVFLLDNKEISTVLALKFYLGACIVSIIAGFFMLWRVAPPYSNTKTVHAPKRSAWFWATISFGAISGVQLVNNNIDIIMLGLLGTREETGIYRATSYLVALVPFGLAVVNAVVVPKIAELHQRGDKKSIQNLATTHSRIVTLSAILATIFLAFFGQFILRTLYGPVYLSGYISLLILALGQLVGAVFGLALPLLNMTGKERISLIAVAASVVINLVLNLVLIPVWGMEGAAVATAASMSIMYALLGGWLLFRVGINCTALKISIKPRV